jgi:hypothetical protein
MHPHDELKFFKGTFRGTAAVAADLLGSQPEMYHPVRILPQLPFRSISLQLPTALAGYCPNAPSSQMASH